MSLLKIARLGHPVLRRKALAVEAPLDGRIQTLIDDMLETLADAGGVGLAAPQVHQSARLVIFTRPASPTDAEGGDGQASELPRMRGDRIPVVLINPVVTPVGDSAEGGFEGCLSIPGLRGVVPRWVTIAVTALDRQGRRVELELSGYEARIVQHEVDHLDGIVYIDRMPTLRTLAFDSEMHHLLEE